MDRRVELQSALESLPGLATDPNINHSAVYFSPPSTVKMVYPCVVYRLNRYFVNHADNRIYDSQKSYSITIIDKNPDSEIPDFLLHNFPMCSYDRFYTADNLNHWVFTLYF